MNRLVRLYNQNRKTIWITIGIIALIILIIQLVNYWVKVDNEETLEKALEEESQTQASNTTQEYNTVTVDEDYSALTGESLSNNQLSQIEVIDLFAEYCNNGQIEEAYNMLTDECKDEMYPEQNNFEELYYNQIFLDTTRNTSVESWISNIYRVTYDEDFLATGQYSTENSKQDYITVEEQEDGTFKLNISGFVGRNEINNSTEKNGITIEVLEENMYMEYTTYTIKVQNSSESTIQLDDGQDIDAMYIEDDNGIQYSAYTHEISATDLIVSPRETKEIEIKYYSRYGSQKDIDLLGFSRVVLNYGENTTKTIESFRIEL